MAGCSIVSHRSGSRRARMDTGARERVSSAYIAKGKWEGLAVSRGLVTFAGQVRQVSGLHVLSEKGKCRLPRLEAATMTWESQSETHTHKSGPHRQLRENSPIMCGACCAVRCGADG